MITDWPGFPIYYNFCFVRLLSPLLGCVIQSLRVKNSRHYSQQWRPTSQEVSHTLLRVGRFSDFPFVFTITYPGVRFKEKMDLTHKKGWFIPAGKIVFFNLIGGDEGVHYSTNHPICCGVDQRSYANSRRSVCYLPLVSVVGTL